MHRPRKFLSTKVGLQQLLMNYCDNFPFPHLLVEMLICKGLFLSKTSKHGSNRYSQLSIVSYPIFFISRKTYSLEVEIEWSLMKSCEKKPFLLY